MDIASSSFPSPDPIGTAKGQIQRLVSSENGSLPKLHYLQRHDVLFTEDEWEFTPEASRAYLFPTHSMADEFAQELSSKGTKCWAVVVSESPARMAAIRRQEDHLRAAEESFHEDRWERHQRMLEAQHLG